MTLKRRIKKLVGLGFLKGGAVRLFAVSMRLKWLFPRALFAGFIAVAALLLKACWFVPFNPWRRAARSILLLGAQGGSARKIYFRLVDSVRFAALGYLDVHRDGVQAVLPRIRMTDKARSVFDEIARGGGKGIFILPHIMGGFFSGIHVAVNHKIKILYKGPRNARHDSANKRLVEPLGLELLVLNSESAVVAAREFLDALRKGYIIVGLSDLLHKRDDTIESTIFGLPAHLPSWPSRFARSGRVPLAVGYVRVRDGFFEIDAADLIRERDLQKSTRLWAAEFERFILSAPWEWAFLCDLRWGRFLAQAAAARSGEKK